MTISLCVGFFLFCLVFFCLLLAVGLLHEPLPLPLLLLGIVPVGERNVEVLILEAVGTQGLDNAAGIRRHEEAVIEDVGNRRVVDRIAVGELLDQFGDKRRLVFRMELRVNLSRIGSHPDRFLEKLFQLFLAHLHIDSHFLFLLKIFDAVTMVQS